MFCQPFYGWRPQAWLAELIANGSFEDPATAGTSFSIPTDWSAVAGSDLANAWMANMTGSWAAGAHLGSDNTPASDGLHQVYFIQKWDDGTKSGLYQVLSTNIQPNTTYTLTVDLGALGPDANGGPYPFVAPTISLGTGSTFGDNLLTASMSSTPGVAAGTWETWSYTYVTGPTVPTATPLRMDFSMVGTSANDVDAFDNIHLASAAAVPEPGTLALSATGLIGLLCYAWRKRK